MEIIVLGENMQYKKGNSSITIDFDQYDNLATLAQKKRYKIKEDAELVANDQVVTIDLPHLKKDMNWIILVDRVFMPVSQRTDNLKYATKLMLGIAYKKRTISKVSIAEFRSLDTSEVFSKEKMIQKIKSAAITICATFVAVNVDTEVRIKSEVVLSGSQNFIETSISPEMEPKEIAQRIAELYSVFKDKHINLISDALEDEKPHFDNQSKKIPKPVDDEDLFSTFLHLLEVAQRFDKDGIIYQKNFPLLGALKIVTANDGEEIAKAFSENYLEDATKNGTSFSLRIYNDPDSLTGMNYHPSYYPMARIPSKESVEKIKALKDFGSAVDFLNK